MKPLRVGVIGYNNVQALDIVGPADAFSIALIEDEDGRLQPCYEVLLVGLTRKVFRAESGLLFQPHTTLREAPPLDTLIVPGGKGSREERINKPIREWIARHAKRIRRIASVCTGVYAVAPSGLLDGRKVTTHWRFAADVARRFPTLQVDHDALFLKDGPFYTSGGITASIDLALGLIEEDYGARVALSVARELVVFLKRAGGQKQYSEPLEFQINATDRFTDLAAWMLAHIKSDLSLETLARRASVSPRHLARRFKQTFGRTPAALVESLRLDEGRRRLAERTQTVENVAASVGFNSDDAFRRAFERRFGVTPSSYRAAFHARAKSKRRRLSLRRGDKTFARELKLRSLL